MNPAGSTPTSLTPVPVAAAPVGPTPDLSVQRILGLLGPSALEKHPYVAGNRADLMIEYGEWIPQLLTDVSSATKVIDVIQFNWEANGPGQTLAALLIEKARAGVEVNVIIDDYGSFSKGGDALGRETRLLFDQMRAAGVSIISYKPKHGLLSNPISRNYEHRKMVDVDHRIAHVGGMGFAEREGKYSDWHDLAMRVEGPAAAQAGAEFVASWTKLGGLSSTTQIGTLLSAIQNPARVGAANVRILPNTPGVRTDATQDFVDAARSARDRLWVMSPYIGDERAAEALIDAKRRGVDVRLIVPGFDIPNNKHETRVSKTFYEDLIKAGIPIYGYERMMHAKAWLADDRLTVGSTNLSRGSLRWYNELSASVDDAATAAKAVRMFESDFAKTPTIQLREVTTIGTRILKKIREITGLSF